MAKRVEFLFIIRLPFWLRLPDGDYAGERGKSSYMLGVRCVDVERDGDEESPSGRLQMFVATGTAERRRHPQLRASCHAPLSDHPTGELPQWQRKVC